MSSNTNTNTSANTSTNTSTSTSTNIKVGDIVTFLGWTTDIRYGVVTSIDRNAKKVDLILPSGAVVAGMNVDKCTLTHTSTSFDKFLNDFRKVLEVIGE